MAGAAPALQALLLLLLAGALLAVQAPAQAATDPDVRQATEIDAGYWLGRLRRASRVPSYVGTYVVSTASGVLTSARIWHLCDGDSELERVDVLSGPPRSVYRHNDRITLVLPEQRAMRTSRRGSRTGFPALPGAGQDDRVGEHYRIRTGDPSRVAGRVADVVELEPRDRYRFGYRIWSERETGLVLKQQTLDSSGRVLEQAAFSELRLDAPMQEIKSRVAIPDAEDYAVEHQSRDSTSLAAEGWVLRAPVVGFESQGCQTVPLYRREPVRQCMFSDGLASISMFFQTVAETAEHPDGVSSMGAVRVLSQRWPDLEGPWRIVLIGEVPQPTLQLLLQNLARQP